MRSLGPAPFRSRHTPSPRGQSLVEFALTLPVMLILVLGAVDFGRLFYAWVTIHNAARVAANYAAINPNGSFGANSEYDQLVRNEGLSGLTTVCPLSGGATAAPQPTFQDTSMDANATPTDLGDTATVSISCDFRIITPVIGNIVGGNVIVEATSVFPIRNGPYQP